MFKASQVNISAYAKSVRAFFPENDLLSLLYKLQKDGKLPKPSHNNDYTLFEDELGNLILFLRNRPIGWKFNK